MAKYQWTYGMYKVEETNGMLNVIDLETETGIVNNLHECLQKACEYVGRHPEMDIEDQGSDPVYVDMTTERPKTPLDTICYKFKMEKLN